MATLSRSLPAAAHEADRAGNHAGPQGTPRIHYFDWLRALAVFGVIAYHTILPFARPNWSIVNEQQNALLLAFAYVFESFGLGVLFLIAGGSVRFTLEHKTNRLFLAERARRLLLPFVLGAILLVPPTSYIVGRHLGTASGSYLAFLAGYPRALWTNSIALKGLSPEVLTDVGMHLWFLAWLFICSGIAIPIFNFLSASTGRAWIEALGRCARWPGALLLFGLPLAVPRLILAQLPQAESGWSLEAYVWYALVFVMGFVLFYDDRIVAAVRRDLWLALVVALLGSYTFLAPGLVWQLFPQTYNNVPFWMGLMGVIGWAWTLAILGAGMRLGFMQRPLPPLVGETSLPAYILHFPIVIGISTLVVDWQLGFAGKVLINASLGVGITLLAAAAVTRIPLLRPLLGLHRSKARPLPAASG